MRVAPRRSRSLRFATLFRGSRLSAVAGNSVSICSIRCRSRRCRRSTTARRRVRTGARPNPPYAPAAAQPQNAVADGRRGDRRDSQPSDPRLRPIATAMPDVSHNAGSGELQQARSGWHPTARLKPQRTVPPPLGRKGQGRLRTIYARRLIQSEPRALRPVRP